MHIYVHTFIYYLFIIYMYIYMHIYVTIHKLRIRRTRELNIWKEVDLPIRILSRL